MQSSFSDLEYAAKKKQTRRDRFLAEIEAVTPWTALEAEIEPFYPKGAGRGRPPIGVGRMLRMYVAQQCFGLSDEGIEDAIYDSQAIRGFVGIDLAREAAPDATTLLKFRRLLERHGLTQKIFEVIKTHLAEKGLTMREGTIVDATLIAAPPSTKNRAKARDPQMHQTKKGNQWYFGMKAHIGVDAESGLVHAVVATAANTSDVSQTHKLLHGEETEVLGDAGYQGVEKRKENRDNKATWHVAMKRSKRKALPANRLGKLLEKLERAKASIRAKVEHPFHVVKNLFKHKKTRYRGLAKNEAQLFTLFGLANLFLARRPLLALRARGAS
ncbi:IS5 family transposase [Azoarcus indigens]|uniref:IS4 family transposase n=1 Tax=Azoarcus indigens TaxID=29545 RepID=A0A4V3BK42_9RHOO|nr:IS5 family transposase [Azoarcus indigens]NMG68171.1 IS5 family transposase [Azoarcus indigens]TDN41402.1 IS4 family transposase [Azoarcus indigens]